jgi:hypothetical protein
MRFMMILIPKEYESAAPDAVAGRGSRGEDDGGVRESVDW